MNNTNEDAILQLMRSASYEPLNNSELARTLNIPSKERAEFRNTMAQLEKKGAIIKVKKGKWALKQLSNALIYGRIKIFRSGRAIFIPDKNDAAAASQGWNTTVIPDVPVPDHKLGTALDGDKVAVRMERSQPKQWKKRHKGRPNLDEMQIHIRIEQIVERKGKQWVGIFQSGRPFGKVFGDGTSTPQVIELTERPPASAQNGQLVVVSPTSWGQGKGTAQGRITEVLGSADSPQVEFKAICRKFNLSVDFKPETLAEARALDHTPPDAELKRREDWTQHTVITIDPEGARDFDDAIAIHPIEEGWELAVHIADVSYYVTPNSPMDKEARERGNSTYLPERVLPMLPGELSNDLCSLRGGVIRFTKVCVMKFNRQGKRIHTRFADAYIKSTRQMTYAEAFALMNSEASDPVATTIKETWKLASILRKNRFAKGALDLDFPDVRVLLNEEGKPYKVIVEEYDESHQLIEECMLAANEAAAEMLKNKSRPAIYRIHEDPNPVKLEEFAQLCKVYGHPVHDLTQRQNLIALMKSIKGSPDEQLLKLSLLKSLMRARYDTEPMGHFGLAMTNYCHFTSPIRRYADLIVHRALNALLPNPPQNHSGAGSVSQLQDAAAHISDTERNSSDAEREANRIKLLEWMDIQSRSEHPEVHLAVITDVRRFGLLVEIPRLQVRGLVKPSDLPKEDGRWRLEQHLPGFCSSSGKRLIPGHGISVIPVSVHFGNDQIDFAIVPDKK